MEKRFSYARECKHSIRYTLYCAVIFFPFWFYTRIFTRLCVTGVYIEFMQEFQWLSFLLDMLDLVKCFTFFVSFYCFNIFFVMLIADEGLIKIILGLIIYSTINLEHIPISLIYWTLNLFIARTNTTNFISANYFRTPTQYCL